MGLSEAIYTPIIFNSSELDGQAGWNKETVDFVKSHKSKVYSSIKGIANGLSRSLTVSDIENIYSEVVIYLYNAADYDVSKACKNFSTSGTIISLRGYIHSCIKYVTMRYCAKKYSIEKNTISESIKDSDGKDISMFDSISDSKSDSYSEFGYELSEICKSFENSRYIYGVDIYQLWFIRLKTISCGKQDKYKDVLDMLSINKRDIAAIEYKSSSEGPMLSIAKAVSLIDIDEALSIVREYTYCANRLEEVIELL